MGLGERSCRCHNGKMLSRQNILHRCLGCCISVGLQCIPMVPSRGPYIPPLFSQHSQTNVGPTSHAGVMFIKQGRYIDDISAILGDKYVKIKKKT